MSRHAAVVVVALWSAVWSPGVAAGVDSQAASTSSKKSASTQAKPPATPPAIPPGEVDGLMAPVALYADQLLAQMLISATTPSRVADLDKWLKTKPPFTGTALQDAARQTGFGPSLVALVLFPQVVDFMTVNLDWTTEVGQVFSKDRNAVLASVQRLRADCLASGKLKSNEQVNVSQVTTDAGAKVIVIEPANPQVVHVPQYSSQTVYTNPPPTTSSTVVIQEQSNDNSAAIAAGAIGFGVGIAIGAAMDNDYYYGPYGWHGSPYMHGPDWDDYYDEREDAREDWYDNREDAREDIQENRENVSENRTDRASNAQEQRTERTQARQEGATDRQRPSGSSASTASTSTERTRASSAEAQGRNRERSSTATQRSGTGSDAFSNYSRGKSERSASSRGQRSRSGGGGGRRK